MIKLLVKAADDAREVAFQDPTILIGRASDCGVKLADRKASRRHARIEKADQVWRLVDLESPNGTLVNGREVDTTVLSVGDEIRIGETCIMIRELDTAPISKQDIEIMQKSPIPIEKKLQIKDKIEGVKRIRQQDVRRPKRLILVGAAVALLLGAGLMVRSVMRSTRSPLDQVIAQRKAVPDKTPAQRVLEELRVKADASKVVTDALIGEVSEASLHYGGQFKTDRDQLNPFDQLIASLLRRRAEDFSSHLGQARQSVEEALASRTYSKAFSALGDLKAYAEGAFEEAVRALVEQADARVGEDFVTVMAVGRRLEESKRYTEAAAHYQIHAPRFDGTIHHVRIKNKPADLTELAKQKALEVKAPAKRPEKPPEIPMAAPVKSGPTGLAATVASLVASGRFAGRAYAFDSATSGSPVATDADTLTVRTTAGDVKLAWSAIPPATLFKMAADIGRGDELLQVSGLGYQLGLQAESDRLLARVLDADRKANKDKVDAVLAKARGLDAVPEGGYTHDPKVGWEDAVQRDNRTASAAAAKHMKDLVASSDPKKRDALFEKFMEVYDRSTLLPETRDALRANAVETLGAWKKKHLEAVQKKARSVGNSQLHALKIELNKRRQEALAVIYDTKIYVREDHPDYPKGDKINGQEEVDRLVNRVKELWDTPATFVVSQNPSIRKDLEELKAANEKYLAALGEEVDSEADLKDFEEILANVSETTLNIKNYSLNGKEEALYAWNRRVDRYNEACRDDGVTAEEKAHAKVLNDYREMMGRRRLFLDGRLCKATKKHSAVCDAAGRIWHVGSDGDPQSRARAEGFRDPVGENVALGYEHPIDVWWKGWYRASDHHRNGLSDAYNCMGYGYAGRVGTQNFANIGTPKGF
ncbi:MAG: FHA domain-containing protein [Planctomycetes bacterium]|nr:FHA domain-containing protein [Planctomycetota bacterium]